MLTMVRQPVRPEGARGNRNRFDLLFLNPEKEMVSPRGMGV
jgi:hypothetical protein